MSHIISLKSWIQAKNVTKNKQFYDFFHENLRNDFKEEE